jgi:AraC family transcriptional regulator of adaptative response/methylated-DNA-[protein]-cysteine methyltransferase
MLPPPDVMYRALAERDPSYEGIFVIAVKTTGIFCRTVCSAKKPKPENVEYFADARAALAAGYRPCKRCQPMAPAGDSPDWLQPVLSRLEDEPALRIDNRVLRDLGVEPARVRRWFQKHHGMTFQAYCRARRLGSALGHLQNGKTVIETAFDSGYESLSGFGTAFAKLFGNSPAKNQRERISVARLLTPLGPMLVAASDDALVLLEFVDRRMIETQLKTLGRRFDAVFVPGENTVLARTQTQLTEYFAGDRKDFDLPLSAPGTPFQELVWQALRTIPYGQTASYMDVAKQIGRPTGFRAVARANGDNRLAIVIPCHRVIAADGSLSGYGGQVWRKEALLELERRTAASDQMEQLRSKTS